MCVLSVLKDGGACQVKKKMRFKGPTGTVVA